jgi:hypothetical protein
MKLLNRNGVNHFLRPGGISSPAAVVACTIVMGTAMHAQAEMVPYTSGFARFSRTSDTIQVLGNTVFNRGDFTYEMHIRFDATGQSGPIDPNSPFGNVISEQFTGSEDKTVQFSSDGHYVVSASWNDPAVGNNSGAISGFPTGDWIHLAYVRSGNVSTIFINGAAAASHITNFAYVDAPGSWMSIGMFRQGAGYIPTPARPSFIGDLDWIRVSSGALYTSNFTPPTESAIAATAMTQLLYKFNEAAGTTTIFDESSNAFQGNLGVAVYPGVTATAPTLMTGTVPAPGAIAILGAAGLIARRRKT